MEIETLDNNAKIKELKTEFLNFLNKHTIYEAIPENTKV